MRGREEEEEEEEMGEGEGFGETKHGNLETHFERNGRKREKAGGGEGGWKEESERGGGSGGVLRGGDRKLKRLAKRNMNLTYAWERKVKRRIAEGDVGVRDGIVLEKATIQGGKKTDMGMDGEMEGDGEEGVGKENGGEEGNEEKGGGEKGEEKDNEGGRKNALMSRKKKHRIEGRNVKRFEDNNSFDGGGSGTTSAKTNYHGRDGEGEVARKSNKNDDETNFLKENKRNVSSKSEKKRKKKTEEEKKENKEDEQNEEDEEDKEKTAGVENKNEEVDEEMAPRLREGITVEEAVLMREEDEEDDEEDEKEEEEEEEDEEKAERENLIAQSPWGDDYDNYRVSTFNVQEVTRW